MREGCIAQDMIVVRPLQTWRGGTSTERLKTGAEQFSRLATCSARRVFRPTGRGLSFAHSPTRRFALILRGTRLRFINFITTMSFDLKSLVSSRMGDNYQLHARHLNPTLVEVLRITGFDRVYTRAQGAYLYDAAGNAYLDFLSGYRGFNMWPNHPVIRQAIRDVLDLDLPNMGQMDCSLLSGLLAEALLKKTPPQLEAIFFCNSGTEAIEGALKFARAATGRPGLVALHGGYHGLSYGSLSVTGIANFHEGFGPLMPNVERFKMADLSTLDRLLRRKNAPPFLVQPVQGKHIKFHK